MLVELITTCRGRGHHLKDSWPSFVAQVADGFEFQAIVVDYGCPDAKPAGCRRLIVRDDVEFYNHPRAKNCGAVASTADVLFFCDCDYILAPTFVRERMRKMTKEKLELLVCGEGPNNFFGCYLITREGFHRAGGFDEAFKNWGYDDTDFIYRCKQRGLKWGWTLAEGLTKIPHTDEDSTRNLEDGDKEHSSRRNLERMRDTFRAINPEGYGIFQPPRCLNIHDAHRAHPLASREDIPAVLNLMGLTNEGAEIGVNWGAFSHHLLAHSYLNRLYSIDPWARETDDQWYYADWKTYEAAAVLLARHRLRAVPMRMLSLDAAQLFRDGYLDFVYIDADHRYEHIRADLAAWWPKVRSGGVMAGHDWCDFYPGVKQAVNEFETERGLDSPCFTGLDEMHEGHTIQSWLFQKP